MTETTATTAQAQDLQAEVVVLGAGPGGYTAAFRAADLGKAVVLIERFPNLGGVCLNVGCIPSKALLHAAAILNEAREMARIGISFGEPQIDLDKLRANKDKVVAKLTGGLAALAKQRKVRVVQGTGRFEAPNRIGVDTHEGYLKIQFDHAIIACGSTPVRIPGFPHEDPRVMDSTGALELASIPARLLILGGGIIGLEMATVYQALGSRIDVVELQDQLIPGCDLDLVKALQKVIGKRYDNVWLGTKVTAMSAGTGGIKVSFEGKGAPAEATYDKVLVAVGRRPNGKLIDADKAGVLVDERGFIPVDGHMRTNVPNIFAIGDVVGNPMLAHKATHEAKVAAEVIAGLPALFDPMTIPSVAYTDPEVAWMGLTETQAKADGHRLREGGLPLGRQRAGAGHRPRRGPDQTPVRSRDQAHPRGRDRRAQCRGADRGGGAGLGDGGRLRGHRPHHPSPPDAERDHRPSRRDGPRVHHRPATAPQALRASEGAASRSRPGPAPGWTARRSATWVAGGEAPRGKRGQAAGYSRKTTPSFSTLSFRSLTQRICALRGASSPTCTMHSTPSRSQSWTSVTSPQPFSASSVTRAAIVGLKSRLSS